MPEMTYERFERSDVDYKADTFGLRPGVAGVYVEHEADVFCRECAEDMFGEAIVQRAGSENVGYDHGRSDELGNIAAVLSNEEWDCPGAYCGHCGIELDVRVIHYEGVCQPEYCSEA